MLPEILLTHAEAIRGESPIAAQGRMSSNIQAVSSLGKLISEIRLPASDKSDRRFGLDASSSRSPRRGSMTGFITLLWRAHSHAPRARSGQEQERPVRR